MAFGGAASAATIFAAEKGVQPDVSPIPVGAGDAILYFEPGHPNPFTKIILDQTTPMGGKNTGVLSTAANGVGIKLQEVGPGGAIQSDYLFAYKGKIVFFAGNDALAPTVSTKRFQGMVDPTTFKVITETGGWQRVDKYLGITTPFYAFSAGAVPEPQSWALMMIGVGMTGYALRRRRVTRTVAG